ncbi:MAG TPA: hypothetical protein VFA75_08080 [Nevskia sp.]|nr:hypothetical protein [Nevskia sp.]
MEQLVITIRPSTEHDGMLRVADAMQQVIDFLRIFDEAERAIASPDEAFEWRLESASTNSPFTVVARAEPRHAGADVTAHVRKVKERVSSGITDLIQKRALPSWMTTDAVDAVDAVFKRSLNGIVTTEIQIAANDTISIDRINAEAGVEAIAGIRAVVLDLDLPERTAVGELIGVMCGVGNYGRKPAIRIFTDLYKWISCTLPPHLVEQFGDTHKLKEVWEGKTLAVEGDLIYAKGGKLSRLEARNIRVVFDAPLIELSDVVDPDFTAGLDPVEYLQKFHEGELA